MQEMLVNFSGEVIITKGVVHFIFIYLLVCFGDRVLLCSPQGGLEFTLSPRLTFNI
jgi:hypothetical protein